ncbi:MAG: DUF2723 domain-containing protein [Armatimonadota bacterium]|nr:DUF2723 domain-containing protein [Armatimonadota bacterium]
MPGLFSTQNTKITRLLAIVVFAVSLALYLKTMCPTIYTMDNAELTVAAYTMGIAHPTGYPLFCLLGKLFTLAIPCGEVAYRINLMNALFGSLASVFLFLLLIQLGSRKTAAFVVSLMFAFSRLFWEISTSGEVYALNSMFIALNFLLIVRWIQARKNVNPGLPPPGPGQIAETDRALYPLAFFTGLALTNHLTSAFIIPGALAAVLWCDRGLFLRWRTLLRLVVLFAAPLSLYLYLPLRAHPSSAMIWDNIYLREGLWSWVSGKMYRGLMFTMPLSMVWGNLIKFLQSFLIQFPIYIAWLLPFGAILLRRRNAPALAVFGIVALVDIVYAVNYKITDIDSYYVPAMLGLAVLIAYGLTMILESFQYRKTARSIVACCLILLALCIGVGNYKIADKSNAYMIKDYADNMLRTVEPKALLVACGDSVFNSLLYDRIVHNGRTDLILVERNVLKTWRYGCKDYCAGIYLEQAAKQAPEIRLAYRDKKFTREQVKREEFLLAIINEAVKVRPVYITCIGNDYETHPILSRMEPYYQLVPEGITFRVLPKNRQFDKRRLALYNEAIWKRYRLDRIYDGSIQGGELEREIPTRYAVFHIRLGDVETDAGMYKQAANNYRKALTIDGRLIAARNGLALAQVGLGDMSGAMKEWRTVLELAPNNRTALHNLQVAQRHVER